jgi:hypothetical protein
VPVHSSEPPRPTEYEERSRRWPSSMVRPSPVQFHATVMVTIFLAILALALWAFLNNRGIGPFDASVREVSALQDGRVSFVVEVRNTGSKTARATCHVDALDDTNARIRSVTLVTDPIAGGESGEVEGQIAGLTRAPASLEPSCR